MSQMLTAATLPTESQRLSWMVWLQKLSASAGLVIVVIIFSMLRPRTFPTISNLQLMLTQTAVVATAALGMTLIIISGGIDLSVGATIAFVTMCVATFINWHWPPLSAAVGGIVAAGIYGLFIGALIGKARLIPFVVTLGTWSIYRGSAEEIGMDRVINVPPNWLNRLMVRPTG